MSDLFNSWGSQAIPFSQEAEEAVIGAVLVNPVSYYGVAAFLQPDDFFILRHKYIWEALARLAARSEPVDYLTVAQELKDIGRLTEIGGPAFLTQLINNTPTSVHAEVYGKLVERAATRRRLLAAADQIKALALDESLNIEQVVADSEAKLFDVTERQLTKELIPMREAMNAYYERIEHLMHNRGGALGVPSGFKDLDKLLGGMQKSDLLIFAGRPGMGKCVAEGTLVSTERGIVPIESLRPQGISGIADDEGGVYYPLAVGVQTPAGLRQTAYFYDSGIRPTLRLTTRAGYALTGTYRHPVLSLNRRGWELWKPVSELQPGDWVAVQAHSHTDPRAYAWDEIAQIRDAGLRPCYDLTVPDGQAFVTNGIVSHNTSFMLSAAINVARLGARIAIFSMEMGVEQIVQRLVSMEAAINSQNLRSGELSPQEWARFVHAAGNMSNFKIYIDDTPAMSPLQMRTKCLRLAREHGIDLIVVDYMQLMNAGGVYENNRVQEISYISRSMKEMARELNVPVLSAAQLSRAVEQRQDKRPVLSDLRESGCLAGESLVYLPDTGQHVPIRDLCGRVGFRVLSLNTDTWKLEPGLVTNAFCTGVKPVYRLTTGLGRSIRATANHKFLTIHGWKRLDALGADDCVAVPQPVSDFGAKSQLTTENTEVTETGIRPLGSPACRPDTDGLYGAPVCDAGHKQPLEIISMSASPSVFSVSSVVKKFALISECTPNFSQSDVYWDTIVAIEPEGETEVYDLTVPGNSNFIGNGLCLHNSIEQDADVVMFLYRDEVYNEATEFPNQAEVIIAKHRNGPTGAISLYFEKTLTKFMNAAERSVDLSHI